MYLPKHFTPSEAQAAEFLSAIRAGDLITPTAQGLYATFLPLLYERSTATHGTLLGHVARKNDHHRLHASGESLVIVHGAEGYITPAWYETKRETGKVVPTWNYLTAHIHGELVIHDDPVWLEDVVRRLTDRHERERAEPWSVDDAPRDYIDAQLKAIVGVELRVTRIEVKAKLGQNRQASDIDGVITGLTERNAPADAELAAATARARRR